MGHIYCRYEGDALEATQSDSAASTCELQGLSSADVLDGFNSFQFWRIHPDVVDDTSVISGCGDSLRSLVISDNKDNWSVAQHADGDSAHRQHYMYCGMPDSSDNLKESVYCQ